MRGYPAVLAVFVTSLIVSNLIAVKIIAVGPLTLPAAVVLFPVAYICGDVLTEVYGYRGARRAIWIGFGCNLLAVLAVTVAGRLPASPLWTAGPYRTPGEAQVAYDAMFGFSPRLLGASLAAYLAGEFLNAFVLARLKVATEGRWLWLRTIGSTVVGQAADSAVFITLAFAGILPTDSLAAAIASQWTFKTAYEAAATPLTYLVVNRLKRLEGADPYDRDLRLRLFPAR
jgi:uncharacterized integral membrane protein (TIGR00697 family)